MHSPYLTEVMNYPVKQNFQAKVPELSKTQSQLYDEVTHMFNACCVCYKYNITRLYKLINNTIDGPCVFGVV